MKINYKKSLKLITLLLISMLISFVSAATYSELYMKATPITIGSSKVKFVLGANTTGIGSINTPQGTIVTFTGMSVDPGQTVTYDEAVNITNTATGTKTLNLSLTSLTGPFSANFESIDITIIATNGSAMGQTIHLSSISNNTSTGNIYMPGNNAEWAVKWVIKAKASATESAQINVELKLKVE